MAPDYKHRLITFLKNSGKLEPGMTIWVGEPDEKGRQFSSSVTTNLSRYGRVESAALEALTKLMFKKRAHEMNLYIIEVGVEFDYEENDQRLACLYMWKP